jgi:hypothetical protein
MLRLSQVDQSFPWKYDMFSEFQDLRKVHIRPLLSKNKKAKTYIVEKVQITMD